MTVPGPLPFIAIYPPEWVTPQFLAQLGPDLRSPVTIQHTLTRCPMCRGNGWIGPKQKAAADAGDGHIICLRCLFTLAPETARTMPVVTLNPDIENVPRRAT